MMRGNWGKNIIGYLQMVLGLKISLCVEDFFYIGTVGWGGGVIKRKQTREQQHKKK